MINAFQTLRYTLDPVKKVDNEVEELFRGILPILPLLPRALPRPPTRPLPKGDGADSMAGVVSLDSPAGDVTGVAKSDIGELTDPNIRLKAPPPPRDVMELSIPGVPTMDPDPGVVGKVPCHVCSRIVLSSSKN